MTKLLNGEKPKYREIDDETDLKMEYSNFTEFYEDIIVK